MKKNEKNNLKKKFEKKKFEKKKFEKKNLKKIIFPNPSFTPSFIPIFSPIIFYYNIIFYFLIMIID